MAFIGYLVGDEVRSNAARRQLHARRVHHFRLSASIRQNANIFARGVINCRVLV